MERKRGGGTGGRKNRRREEKKDREEPLSPLAAVLDACYHLPWLQFGIVWFSLLCLS